MQITQTYDPMRRVTKYELEISDHDLIDGYGHLTAWDELLLQGCRTGSVADWLLALETIVRKIEEVREQKWEQSITKELSSGEFGETEVWFIAV